MGADVSHFFARVQELGLGWDAWDVEWREGGTSRRPRGSGSGWIDWVSRGPARLRERAMGGRPGFRHGEATLGGARRWLRPELVSWHMTGTDWLHGCTVGPPVMRPGARRATQAPGSDCARGSDSGNPGGAGSRGLRGWPQLCATRQRPSHSPPRNPLLARVARRESRGPSAGIGLQTADYRAAEALRAPCSGGC